MSFGKMLTPFTLIATTPTLDHEGFATQNETVLHKGRAYFEPRNSTEKWRNNAAFAEATALFRFRAIPNIMVDTTMLIDCLGKRYNIMSVENVRGRGMYYEVLATKNEASKG